MLTAGSPRPSRYRVLDKTNPWRVWIISLLIAVMPLTFALPFKAKAVPMAVLFLLGIVMLATDGDVRRIVRRAGVILLPAAVTFLFWIANVAGHGLAWREFDVASHVLVFLLIAVTFASPLRAGVIRIGFSASAGVLGVVCLEQRYMEGIERVYGLNNGFWGAIEFAMFMLVLTLIAVVQALRNDLRRRERVLHALFAALGLYGALLTQSRGPLLAFLPVFAALVLFRAHRTGRWRQSLVALVLGVAVVGIAATTLHGEMMQRFAAVKNEVSTYSEQDATGAVRERLEMWRAAGMAVVAHPLGGVGMNQFGEYSRSQIDQGRVNASVVRYDHPHSEYLEWATTGGIPGLVLLLWLYGSALFWFGRRALHPDRGVAVPAAAGFATAAMYALCSLTDNVFYRAMPHSLYFFVTLGLAVYVARAIDDVAARPAGT